MSWGVTGERAAKLADCEARARAQGLGAIRWPDPWPTSDVLVARAMIVADRQGALRRFALTAMRMAFAEGRDLGTAEAVRAVAVRSGLAGDEVDAAMAGPEVKAALRAMTDEAIARGVCGVPTVRVGATLFWGDDRLGDAALAAAGDRARAEASP